MFIEHCQKGNAQPQYPLTDMISSSWSNPDTTKQGGKIKTDTIILFFFSPVSIYQKKR